MQLQTSNFKDCRPVVVNSAKKNETAVCPIKTTFYLVYRSACFGLSQVHTNPQQKKKKKNPVNHKQMKYEPTKETRTGYKVTNKQQPEHAPADSPTPPPPKKK
jgi:hypothetical protein